MGRCAIGPRDCALLFGVPLTFDDFKADLAAGPERDYVAGSFGYADEPVVPTLWALYSDVAKFMNTVADEVSALGVNVVRRANHDDIGRAAQSYAVVTIVAHWRDGGVRAWEIGESSALARLLQSPVDELARRLRGMLQPSTIAMFDAVEEREWRRAVAHDISLRLPDVPLADDLWFTASNDSKPPSADIRRDINGALLRHRLRQFFRGAIGVELRDGIDSAERVAARLPPKWSGTLDLTVCHSVLLGEVVKRKFPASTVVTNLQRASPQVRLTIYRELIGILHEQRYPYDKALLQLRDRLNQLRG
jgi:hypothetical protein